MTRHKYFLLFFLLIFISSEILYAREAISLKQILEMPTEDRLELLKISVNSLISADKLRDCPRALIVDYETAEAKVDIDKNLTAFMITLYYDDLEVFNFLLETIKKGDINIQFKKNTILHYAAEMNNVEMVRALIEAGADVNALDRYKRTPLFITTQRGL